MKKSTLIYSVGILFIVGGSLFSVIKGPFSFSLPFLLIFIGARIGKKGTEFYNMEHGWDKNKPYIRTKAQATTTYGMIVFMLAVSLILIFFNYFS